MSENRSPMFIRPETVAGQENNMIPCGVATKKRMVVCTYTLGNVRAYSIVISFS